MPKLPEFIAIDCDGTIVDHRFPHVGEDVPGAKEVLRELAKHSKLILWTMRSKTRKYPNVLADAVQWFKDRDIPLYGVNQNPDQADWSLSPKAYAGLYIDDAALGAPLTSFPGMARPVIDWHRVSVALDLPLDLQLQVFQLQQNRWHQAVPEKE